MAGKGGPVWLRILRTASAAPMVIRPDSTCPAPSIRPLRVWGIILGHMPNQATEVTASRDMRRVMHK